MRSRSASVPTSASVRTRNEASAGNSSASRKIGAEIKGERGKWKFELQKNEELGDAETNLCPFLECNHHREDRRPVALRRREEPRRLQARRCKPEPEDKGLGSG